MRAAKSVAVSIARSMSANKSGAYPSGYYQVINTTAPKLKLEL